MPPELPRREAVAGARRIVVKVGTAALTVPQGRLDEAFVESLSGQIAGTLRGGLDVALVSSGAIGAGMAELDLPARPKTLPMLQATAAVGQGQLMRTFHDAFARCGVRVAQVLVTRDDFEDRTRYLNIRNTLGALGKYGALAIINENDTVAVDEIRFGENDVLAAIVANLLGADLLVLLSVVDGVMKDGEVLDVIERVDDETMSLVTGGRAGFGTGGMGTKLRAADMVTRAGEAAVIANAHTPNVLTRILAGERVGTVFVPAGRKMSSRRRWIGLTTRPAGAITVDDGAARALTERGKSLLPSGITAIEGRFVKGALVAVVTADGREIARGLTNYSAEQIEKIKGLKTARIAGVLGDKPYNAVVHRDNMTVVD